MKIIYSIVLSFALFACNGNVVPTIPGTGEETAKLSELCIDAEASYKCRYAYAVKTMTKLTRAVRKGYNKGAGPIPKKVAASYHKSVTDAREHLKAAKAAAAIGDEKTAFGKISLGLSLVSDMMYLLD